MAARTYEGVTGLPEEDSEALSTPLVPAKTDSPICNRLERIEIRFELCGDVV